MGQIILNGISVEDLLNEIQKRINTSKNSIGCKDLPSDAKGDFISRKETCKILKISLPTLNYWTKKGVLPSYRIQSRVLYKLEEVNAAVNKRDFTKFNGKGAGNA